MGRRAGGPRPAHARARLASGPAPSCVPVLSGAHPLCRDPAPPLHPPTLDQAGASLLLAGNNLSGPALPPAWLRAGALPALKALDVSGNAALAGTLPAELAWPHLTTL